MAISVVPELYRLHKQEDGRIITSDAVKLATWWGEEGLLIPHEPIRHILITVDYLLNNEIEKNESWKLVNFFEWYETRFSPLIHGHHDNEEKIYFPFASSLVEFPEKQSVDHKYLVRLLDELSNLKKDFYSSGGNEHFTEQNTKIVSRILPVLGETWHQLRTMMMPHLCEEEQVLRDLVAPVTTEKKYLQVVNKIIQREGYHGIFFFLVYILLVILINFYMY